MGKLNFWPFGGKTPKATDPNQTVKLSVLLIKETTIGYSFSGNNFAPVSPDAVFEEIVKYRVGTFMTLQDGSIIPNYLNGYLALDCKTEEEAEKVYKFIVKNNGKIRSEETLKETVLVTY